MGNHNTPFIVNGDPNEKDFKIENLSMNEVMADRLQDRVSLLKGVDNLRRDIDANQALGSMDNFNKQAMDMLFSKLFVMPLIFLSKVIRSETVSAGMHGGREQSWQGGSLKLVPGSSL